MYDDPIGALEAELLAAARRRAVQASRARRRPTVGGVLAAVAAVAALIVAGGAVVLLSHRAQSGGPSSDGAQTTRANSLPLQLPHIVKAVIGAGPVSPRTMAQYRSVLSHLGDADSGSTTFTAGEVTAPGRIRIGLWEVVTQARGGPVLDEFVAVVGGRVVYRAAAASIREQGALFAYGYTGSGTRIAVVVPNHVVRVRLLVPGTRSMLAAVHDNIAAFEVEATRLTGARVVWYSRDGRVIRHT